MQHEVGDQRLLERRRESLDELRRQPPDESDRVGHEVALAVVLERARRRIERLEQAVVDGRLGPGERVQERRLADVRVAGECDRRARSPARAPCAASSAVPRAPRRRRLRSETRVRARRRSVSSWLSPGPRVPTPPPRRSRCCHMPRMRGRLYSSCASSTWSLPSELRACCAKMSRISCVRSTTRALELVLERRAAASGSARRRRAAPRRLRRRTPPSAPRASPCRRTFADRVRRDAARPRRRVRRPPSARARAARRARRSPSEPFGIDADEGARAPAPPQVRDRAGAQSPRDYAAVRSGGDRARRSPRRADARARGHLLAERQRGGDTRASARARSGWLGGRVRRRRGVLLRPAASSGRCR